MHSFCRGNGPCLSKPGWFPVDLGLGALGRLAAFGDFNGDKMTDIFTVEANAFSINEWDHATFKFIKTLTIQLPTNHIIDNIIATDFNYDGKLDVLVVSHTSSADLLMRVYYGDGANNLSDPEILSYYGSTQPFIVDLYGNMHMSIVGMVKDSPTLHEYSFSASNNSFANQITSQFTKTPTCLLTATHSSAFIDMNGDCLADIVLVCGTTLQIWINKKNLGFVKEREYKLPDNIGPITFADFDADGTTDLIFGRCYGFFQVCEMNIVYNKQKSFCTGGAKDGCVQTDNLCVADDTFELDFINMDVYDVTSLIGSGVKLSDSGAGLYPISVGDFNSDGYPDFLISTSQSGVNNVELIESIACTPGTCKSGYKRALKRVVTDTLQKANRGVFMDFDEDKGTLDILLMTKIGDIESTRAVYNNFFFDAFFMKALTSNGVCPKYCPIEAYPHKPYGVNYAGAMYKFVVYDIRGNSRVASVAQMSQTANTALSLPYAFIGLGRTNNYVEDFYIGTTRWQPDHYLQAKNIIPNSQIIIMPYQPNSVNDASTWTFELFVSPSSYSSYVSVVWAVSLLLIGLVMLTLHYLERVCSRFPRVIKKVEDKAEKKRTLHNINYDAL